MSREQGISLLIIGVALNCFIVVSACLVGAWADTYHWSDPDPSPLILTTALLAGVGAVLCCAGISWLKDN